IPEVEVTSLVGGNQDATAQVAKKYGIPHYTGELSEGIKRADAVILTTPTKMHFRQGEQVMRAGKHVLVEIPITDGVEDAEALVKIAKQTGVTAMGGHVRRFNPSHQWVHKRIQNGELKVQQMDVQTYFFRRKNINAAGQPRSWTDHLLWHHAAHTIDLFQYQAGETISDCYAVQGPIHPQLHIAMDMGIVAKTPSGAVLTLSLSFNNDGPLGSFFRYICDNGTYKAYYDDLSDGKDNKIDLSKVDVSMDGIELEDREFVAAVKEKREPNASLKQLLPCMHVLGRLEKIVDPQRKAHAYSLRMRQVGAWTSNRRSVGMPVVGRPSRRKYNEKVVVYCRSLRRRDVRRDRRRAGAGRQNRLDFADDRPAAIDRQTGGRRCQALYGAAWRHCCRQEDRADHQGRRRGARQHQAHRAGSHRQRQGHFPRRLRRNPRGPCGRSARQRGQDAGNRHCRRHFDHHREIALHRADQLHLGTVDGADGGLGGGERHQESREHGVRLRARRRCREVVQG